MVPWFAGAISRGTGPETALEGRSRALQLVQRVRSSKSLLLWMQDVRRMLLMVMGSSVASAVVVSFSMLVGR